jgi:hypothetical protein
MLACAQHIMDRRHHVLAIQRQCRRCRQAQCRVQHRAFFADIDTLAAAHALHPDRQIRLMRQVNQQLQRALGDAVFRIIQQQAIQLQEKRLKRCGSA